jgi:hypothetical protein
MGRRLSAEMAARFVGGRKKIHQPPAYDSRVVMDVSGNAVAVSSQSDGIADAENPQDLDFALICDRIATKSAAVDSTKI